MRKLFIILGIVSAVLAVLLALLPLSNLAFIPAAIAFICGLIAFVMSNKSGASKKTVVLIFLLTIIALSFASYKAVFTETKVGNTEELQEKEKASEEEAIEELEDLDLEDIDIE
ncbi:FUSC family protein [Corallibacter sp.]|uniref:FUSC family protein n=1 Tax=Corallibacter sp. TaxID=2038084 RepID=UPI003A8F0A1A